MVSPSDECDVYKSECKPDEFLKSAAFDRSPDGHFATKYGNRVAEMMAGKTVLDVGCGDGTMWIRHFDNHADALPQEVCLVDMCNNFVETAKKNVTAAARQLPSAPSLCFRSEDMHALADEHPEWHGHFDLVISNFVFHHSTDLSHLFETMSRLLKKGGVLLFTANATANTPPVTCGAPPLVTISLNGVHIVNRAYPRDSFFSALTSSGFDVFGEDVIPGNYKIVGWDENAQRRVEGWEANHLLFDEEGEKLVDVRAIRFEARLL